MTDQGEVSGKECSLQMTYDENDPGKWHICFKLFSFCMCDFKGQGEPQRCREENESHSKEKQQYKEKSDLLRLNL